MPDYTFDTDGLLKGLLPQSNPVHSRQAVELVARSYQTMKRDQLRVKDIYKPAGEWDSYIKLRQACYETLLSGNIDNSEKILENFWRNELSPIVKQYASFDSLAENLSNENKEGRKEGRKEAFLDKMNTDLMVWKELSKDQNIASLAVPNVGNMWGIMFEGTLLAPKALRYKLLSEQICNLIADESAPVVVEIGGGYGGMPYYLSNECRCLYFDFDLPETLVIAMYYHLCANPEKRIYLYEGMDTIPSWEKLTSDYDLIFLPNWCLELLPPESVTCFVNSFSFSEMTFPVLECYFTIIAQACKKYLLHNNMDRVGVIQHGVKRVPASHYPIDPEAFRLIYKKFDSFQIKKQGKDGDYREYLYKKRNRSNS